MDVLVLGLNHKTAPLEVREKMTFSGNAIEDVLPQLSKRPSVQSGLILSTCNRVEIYVAGLGQEKLLGDAQTFLKDFHHIEDQMIERHFFSKFNRDAVRHLFRVAGSLDSMVVGEPQILGQVKEAYIAARELSLSSPFFDRLFHRAFSTAKRIRSETEISKNAVSISYAAVELAGRIFGDFQNNSALILGAGEMAELAAKHLVSKGIGKIVFTNRSYAHSVELAQEYKGIPVPFDERNKYMKEADVVIVSTGAPDYLVTKSHVEEMLEERKREPMFFIDISVPRNVDPGVEEIADAYLYNIDDLQGVVEQNLKTRKEEAQRAEEIIELEIDKFYQAIDRLSVSPVIQLLQEKFSVIQQAELGRLRGRLSNASDQDLEEISRAMESLVKKVLNRPILFLKGEEDAMKERSELLRQVFGLIGTKRDKS